MTEGSELESDERRASLALRVESVLERAAAGRRACPLTDASDRTGAGQRSYLVDPASSHMLVSKIKPCMSKHKL